MKQYTVQLSDEGEKAMLTGMTNIQEQLQWQASELERHYIEAIVTEYSDKQPRKISQAEKIQIVRDAKVKSAAERSAEMKAPLEE